LKIKEKHFTLHIDWLFIPTMPLVIYAGYFKEYLITFCTILLHEIGHMIAAALFGKKIYSVRVLPVGLNIDIEKDTDSQWKYILIYSAGPFINILLSTFFLILSSYYYTNSGNMRFFIYVNIYLAVFNLLPVIPLDGGRILNEVLTGWVGLFSAARYTKRTSLVICILLILFGALQIFFNPSNLSLIFIGVFILFSLKSAKTEAALMNIKKIIYRRSRLFKKGVYPARGLVVIKSMYLGETINNMDFDRFHIIHVLDNDLRLVKTFTEQEIFEAILKSEGDMTFEQLIDDTK